MLPVSALSSNNLQLDTKKKLAKIRVDGSKLL